MKILLKSLVGIILIPVIIVLFPFFVVGFLGLMTYRLVFNVQHSTSERPGIEVRWEDF